MEVSWEEVRRDVGFQTGDVKYRMDRGGGRLSWMVVGVMMHVMENGPMKRGASLGLVVRRGMSRADSQTFCPTV